MHGLLRGKATAIASPFFIPGGNKQLTQAGKLCYALEINNQQNSTHLKPEVRTEPIGDLFRSLTKLGVPAPGFVFYSKMLGTLIRIIPPENF